MWFDQHEYQVRCEWGSQGISTLGSISDIIIVIDVLSFSTSVDIALSRGASVIPAGPDQEAALALANQQEATLAQDKSSGGFSLSPQSLQNIPASTRLVLPSPNGAHLSQTGAWHPHLLTACLRNAARVAQYVRENGKTLALVPAGERWEDGSLRPCWEDWIGAGAIAAHLAQYFRLSPETENALAAYLAVQNRLAQQMEHCSSGRELQEKGLATDLALASALNSSNTVPRLVEGVFVPA